MRSGEAEVKNKQWGLMDRKEQLIAHRENLNLQRRLDNIQQLIDREKKELARWPDDANDGETVESLTAQIDAINAQIQELSPTATDPQWTAKLTDGSLGAPGSEAYNAHLVDEPNWQVPNPEKQTLEDQKKDLELSRNRKGNPEQATRNAEIRAEISARLAEQEKEYAKWSQNLTEVTITAVDTSIVDGEIKALEASLVSLDSEIAAFPEDKKLIQDPEWTTTLLRLTEEVVAAGAALANQEAAIAEIAVFIPDPANDAAQIQNPAYTEADQLYAELSLAKSAKQTEYENHIRNQGQVNNPDFDNLVASKSNLSEQLTAKKAEKDVLLSGGTAESGGLPTSEAAIQRELKNLQAQIESLWNDWEQQREQLEVTVRQDIEASEKVLEKERRQQDKLITENLKIAAQEIIDEFNKKPQEIIDLEERFFGINDKRNAFEDKRYAANQEFEVKVQALEVQFRDLDERRRNLNFVHRGIDERRRNLDFIVGPIENQVRELESQIDGLFLTLENAYDEKKELQKELGQVEREIADLAREAESDVLTLITDAMTAAEELESSGPLDFAKFQAFGEMPGDDDEGEE